MQQAVVDRLIDGIYEAAENASAWQHFLVDLCAALRASGARLLHQSTLVDTRSSAPREWIGLATEPDAYERYSYRLEAQGFFAPEFVITSTPTSLARYRERAPFRKEFNSLNARCDTQTSPSDSRGEPHRATVMSVVRDPEAPPFGHTELWLIEKLRPHVERALILNGRLEDLSAQAVGLREIIEQLPVGVALLDARGTVVLANTSARAIADAEDGFAIDRTGLRGGSPDQTCQLRTLVAAAGVADHQSVRRAGAMTLSRRSGAKPLRVFVSGLDTNQRSSRTSTGIAVFVMDPEQASMVAPAMLRSLYGVTSTEAIVVSHLVRGDSTSEIAKSLSIRVSTVRWHVKQILHKVGARNQADLVRIVLSGPAIFARVPRRQSARIT